MNRFERIKKRNNDVKRISEATGWSKSETKNKLKKANSLGISAGKYATRHLYDLNDEELNEFAKETAESERQDRELRDYYVTLVSKRSGWSKEKALVEMQAAEKVGIVFYKYAIREAWDPGEGEWQHWIDNARGKKERTHDTRELYFDNLCQVTGWSRGKAELEHMKIVNNCGASKADILIQKLYDMTPEEQRTYVTHRRFNKLRATYNSHRQSRVYFKDKSKFNETFADYVVRKWFTTDGMTFEQFKENIAGLDRIIVKPLDEQQGNGIETFKCNISEEDDRSNYNRIMKMGDCIAEQYIVQHEDVMKMCPTSVNTVRIATMNDNGECKFLFAALRIGNGDVIDNFHAGGVAASIDLETGELVSDAFDAEGNEFECTPATGAKVKGFRIPNWDKLLEVCRNVSGMVEGVNLVGWDFAITPEGVDLIEGNAELGHGTAQAPGMPGIAYRVIDPYI